MSKQNKKIDSGLIFASIYPLSISLFGIFGIFLYALETKIENTIFFVGIMAGMLLMIGINILALAFVEDK